MDIILRKWSNSDLDSLIENANNRNITTYLRDCFPSPYTLADGKAFISFCTKAQQTTNYAIVLKDSAIGNISLEIGTDIKQRSAELGYWIGEQYWNKGYTTVALQQIIQIAKTTSVRRLFAEVIEENIASIRILEKCGFKQEGYFSESIYKNGKFYNSYIYALLLNAD